MFLDFETQVACSHFGLLTFIQRFTTSKFIHSIFDVDTSHVAFKTVLMKNTLNSLFARLKPV